MIRTHRFTGECADASQVILEVLEDGSLEAVLYLPQHAAQSLSIGQDISVYIQPHPQPVACTVVRVGDQLEAAPKSIQRYYRDQKLLPVTVRLQPGVIDTTALRLGSEVRLPSRWSDPTALVRRAWASAGSSRADPSPNP